MLSLQDHVNLYQDIKVLTIYCSIIGKPISGQDRVLVISSKVLFTIIMQGFDVSLQHFGHIDFLR